MSKFKVGDRVRRVTIENSGEDWCLPVGSTATVQAVNPEDDGLEGIMICDIVGQVGKGAEREEHLSLYFELVQEPAKQAAKQAAKAGGLQEHSLGDCYPYAVVGYGNGGVTTFVVENLQTGETQTLRDGTLATCDAKLACQRQQVAYRWKGGWSKERPRYVNGNLSLPDEPSTTYATSLVEQETVLGRKLTPREQYQLAMEIGK